ncbi:MAG: hypothetical protein DRP57_03130 [Spirochaetes bacterium]|nr:MAG: hypothetical protein DRP57_03130 [Spirochaetota bacterium]
MEALVVGVLLNVVLDFGKRGLKGSIEAVIAVVAFAVLVLNFNIILLIFLALAAGALLLRPGDKTKRDKEKISKSQNGGGITHVQRKIWWKIYLQIGFVLLFVLAGIGLAVKISSPAGDSALSFFKIGSIAFGNGLTILPLIQADTVEKFHWLTLNQFMDGIALSQITPGAFLVIATFIGFELGGVWAALLTTFAMFSPFFAFTLTFTEIFSHVKNLAVVKGALAGVLAAFVGLLSLF